MGVREGVELVWPTNKWGGGKRAAYLGRLSWGAQSGNQSVKFH